MALREKEDKSVGIGLAWEPKLDALFPAASSSREKSLDSSISPKLDALFPAASSSREKSLDSSISSQKMELIDGLYVPPTDPKKYNKLLRKQLKDTAGKHWFDMPAPTVTPEMKKDLQLLKLRNALDPKRHYKKGDTRSKTLPKYFQVGTVVESASEYYSGRLTKKERKATLADELLSDVNLAQYRKRKVQQIEEEHRPGGVDKWKIKGRQSFKRAKQRRH